MSADKKPFLTDRENEVLAKSWLCMRNVPDVRIADVYAMIPATDQVIYVTSPCLPDLRQQTYAPTNVKKFTGRLREAGPSYQLWEPPQR